MSGLQIDPDWLAQHSVMAVMEESIITQRKCPRHGVVHSWLQLAGNNYCLECCAEALEMANVCRVTEVAGG